MENSRIFDFDEDNGSNQNADIPKNLKVAATEQAQNESKYDSHSETEPHQKNIVATDENPDRVSHVNSDTTVNEIVKNKDTEEQELENLSKTFPKSKSSSFPSIS